MVLVPRIPETENSFFFTRCLHLLIMDTPELLGELISFPSVSDTSNAEISEFVDSQLESLDFEIERLTYQDPQGVEKFCVCARRGPAGRGLAYFCHTDVVPATSWSFPDAGPWTAWQTADRIYGRGACDMKGSLACMLQASRIVVDTKQPLFIVCSADEEIGFGGARHVATESDIFREIVSSDSRGIIGEPTSLDVVYAHKGGRAGTITARGVAAHSATSRGENANMAMIPFLAKLREVCLECNRSDDWRDNRFDPPTISMNIGINDHSPAINITAPQSTCTYYFRPMPGQDADGLAARIRNMAVDCGLEFEPIFSGDPLYTDPQSEFIQELAHLSGTQPRTVSYGTDASALPAVRDLAVLGPGDIRQAHTDDEWISLEQLQRGIEFYATLICHWCVD